MLWFLFFCNVVYLYIYFKEQSQDRESTNGPDMWKDMTRNDPPRMVLSITGSGTKPKQKRRSFENLHKAIYDTTRKCRGNN